MDPNQIDASGLPATALILVIAFAIVFALVRFHQKRPEVAEMIQNATPWMGWCEEDEPRPIIHRHPNSRW